MPKKKKVEETAPTSEPEQVEEPEGIHLRVIYRQYGVDRSGNSGKRVELEPETIAEFRIPAASPFGALTFEQIRAGIAAGLFQVSYS